jgi:hypothetical protein
LQLQAKYLSFTYLAVLSKMQPQQPLSQPQSIQIEKSVVQQSTLLPGQPTQPVTTQPFAGGNVGYGATSSNLQPVPMATAVQPGGTTAAGAGTAGAGSAKYTAMAKGLWRDLKGATQDIANKFNSSMSKSNTAGAGRAGTVNQPIGSTGATAPMVGTQASSTATYPAGTLPTASYPMTTGIGQPVQPMMQQPMVQQQPPNTGVIGQPAQLSGSSGTSSAGGVPIFQPK